MPVQTLDPSNVLNDDPDAADGRSVRACEEPMLVLPRLDERQQATGLYAVKKLNNGAGYVVDLTEGACTCPDMAHNDPAGGCKHLRRVEFEITHFGLPDAGDLASPEYLRALAVLDEAATRVEDLLDDLPASLDGGIEQRLTDLRGLTAPGASM